MRDQRSEVRGQNESPPRRGVGVGFFILLFALAGVGFSQDKTGVMKHLAQKTKVKVDAIFKERETAVIKSTNPEAFIKIIKQKFRR